MTPDLIQMAQQAGFTPVDTADGSKAVYTYMKGITQELERFATLVGNKKLEEAAQECDRIEYHGNGYACGRIIRNLKDKT